MAKQPAMQPGSLDRLLDIIRPGNSLNSKGEIESTSFGPYLYRVPCYREDTTSTESPESGRETAFGRTEFTIRWRDDVNETMRVVFEGTEYDIESVREGPGRRQWSVITARKRN